MSGLVRFNFKIMKKHQSQDLAFSQPVILKPTKFFHSSLRSKPALNFLSDLSFPSTFLSWGTFTPETCFLLLQTVREVKNGNCCVLAKCSHLFPSHSAASSYFQRFLNFAKWGRKSFSFRHLSSAYFSVF